MIIRVVAVVSLVSLLIMVLYLPSAHPPEHFLVQLHAEHDRNAAFWGNDFAMRILARMLEFQTEAKQALPIPPSLARAPAPSLVDAAVAVQISQMNARLFNNPYFRSLDALQMLATYRFAVFVEWLPCLLVFVFAGLCDGFMMRIVKGKEFLQHNPEMVALHVCMVILLACGTVLAFVIPVTLHPAVLPVVPVCIGVFAGLAVANFHRRG